MTGVAKPPRTVPEAAKVPLPVTAQLMIAAPAGFTAKSTPLPRVARVCTAVQLRGRAAVYRPRWETLLFASQYVGGPGPGCGFTWQRSEGDGYGRDDGQQVGDIDHGWDAELAGGGPPGHPTAQHAEGDADDQGGAGERARLPSHGGADLPAGEPDYPQDCEITAAAPHRGHQQVRDGQ